MYVDKIDNKKEPEKLEKEDDKQIPKFYNLLEYTYKYNIPEIFKDIYKDSEVDGKGEYGLEGYQQSFLTKEMLDLNYYQEVRKFIKKNNLKIGDILFIGRKSGDLYSSPGDGFAIVTDIDNFETGKEPFYGIDIVFNPNILFILQKNGITYKECFEKISEKTIQTIGRILQKILLLETIQVFMKKRDFGINLKYKHHI